MIALRLIVTGIVALGETPPQPHAADFNASFSVDLADFAVFSNAFGVGIGDPPVPEIPYRAADLDADGDIDRGDFVRFLSAMTGPPRQRSCLTVEDCDDHNPCTGEWCNPPFGCSYYGHPGCCHNDFACDDFDSCTSVCRQNAGGLPFPVCSSTTRFCCFFDVQCNDGINCTVDTCDLQAGCVNTPFAPCCGNGQLETDEACDDGNNHPGDGCDPFCQREPADNCLDAEPIGDGTTAFSNFLTNTDGPGSCGGIGSDVWFEYAAPCSGTVYIDTAGSSSGFTTVLAAYDGCSCSDVPASDCCRPHPTVGCDEVTCQTVVCTFDSFCCTTEWDGFCVMDAVMRCGGLCTTWPDALLACDDVPANELSSISFAVVQGNCYKLQVGGFSGQQAPGVINVDSGCCGDGDLDPGEECESDGDCQGLGCTDCHCACAALHESCTKSAQCCDSNASCDFNTCGGGRVCCMPPGQTCSAGNAAFTGGSCHCCGASVCQDGICCIPLGTFCLSDYECCGGFRARCQSGTCCAAPGAACLSGSDCCSGGQCDGGFCCSTAGGECQFDSDCCTGLFCNGGTCEGI